MIVFLNAENVWAKLLYEIDYLLNVTIFVDSKLLLGLQGCTNLAASLHIKYNIYTFLLQHRLHGMSFFPSIGRDVTRQFNSI